MLTVGNECLSFSAHGWCKLVLARDYQKFLCTSSVGTSGMSIATVPNNICMLCLPTNAVVLLYPDGEIKANRCYIGELDKPMTSYVSCIRNAHLQVTTTFL